MDLQVSEEIAAHLKEAGVEVKAYSAVAEDIKTIAAGGVKLWMDSAKVRIVTNLKNMHVLQHTSDTDLA